MDADDRAHGEWLVATGMLTPAQLAEIQQVQHTLAALGRPCRLADLLPRSREDTPARHEPACDDALATRLARCLRVVTRLAL